MLSGEFGRKDEIGIAAIMMACERLVQMGATKDCPPAQMFLNCFDKMASGKIQNFPLEELKQSMVSGKPELKMMEHAMAYTMLAALIKYSLKNTTWEKFLPEYKIALTEYVKNMYEERAAHARSNQS